MSAYCTAKDRTCCSRVPDRIGIDRSGKYLR